KKGVLYTPHADSCLPGITRAMVIKLAREDGETVVEKNLSLTEVYSSDEMFTTGTMGELTPVLEVDGRRIGEQAGELTGRMQTLHGNWVRQHGTPIKSLNR
ncbi:MAG: aminotransferase class IV, partial [Chromatiales bacterium]|nr:aminotransferase class IV [Chromatiales bacterium]